MSGGFSKDVTEFCNIAILADLDRATSDDAELRSSDSRNAARPGLGRNPGRPAVLNYDVHELLECPVCTNPMERPIYQCPNGHTLCSNCKGKVRNSCPTCRRELGNIRCLALEKVSESLELPCRYQVLGCHDILPYYSKIKHEKHCKHRPFNCPYTGNYNCFITGDIPHLIRHLKNDHKIDMLDGCSFNLRYWKSSPQEVGDATRMLSVFNCFGRQFCLNFEAFQLERAPVYMAFLRFMGEEEEAKQFSYSMEVGGKEMKLTWKGKPRSIRDSHKKVRDNQDGLIIHRSLALNYLSDGNMKDQLKLKISGRIWRAMQ